MEKIKVGVIGVGYLGNHHAEKYAAMADVELVGVADSSMETAEKIAKKYNTTPYNDYQELLNKVDAVSVVVPTPLHYEITTACFDKNVDVMLEKPMTRTLEEADELIRISKDKNLILQVGHLERFNPAVRAMDEYLTCPVFIESRRLHHFHPRGTDVDVVLDLMIHDIDIILSITPHPLIDIRTVGASVLTDYTDIANCQLTFADGCTANVTVSRIEKGEMVRNLRIFQPGSSILVNYAAKEITITQRKNGQAENGSPLEEDTYFCYTKEDALANELSHFIQSVRLRQRPLVSGREGREALEVALKIMDQIKTHHRDHKDLLCED